LLEDPDLRVRMGLAARAHAKGAYGIEREADALIAVYRRLLDT
jgi:glycosyltransferase involved in cell wall biosynthesis